MDPAIWRVGMMRVVFTGSVCVSLALVAVVGCERAEVVEVGRPSARGELVEVVVGDPAVEQQPSLRGGGGEGPSSYFAYLPANAPEPLPVLYLLSDVGQDQSAFPFFLGLGALLDELIESGDIEPMLVIMPNGLTGMGGGFYTDSVLFHGGDAFADAAFGPWGVELLRVIEDAEQRFSTDTGPFDSEAVLAGEGSARGRAIGGLGLGAYGAFVTALRAPVFEALLLHSGFFDLRSGVMADDPVLGESWGDRLLGESADLLGIDHLVPESAGLRAMTEAPMTRLIFSMAAAFSPAIGPLDSFDMASLIDTNLVHADPDGDPLSNFQYPIRQVEGVETPEDPDDDLWLGVWLPIQAGGGIVDGVLLRWSLYYDPLFMAGNGVLMEALESAGTQLWIDAGIRDEYGLADDAERFAAAVEAHLSSIVYEQHSGAHDDRVSERLRLSLRWVSERFGGDG